MDEFRREYEYEDEKVGGFLVVFFIMLLTAETIFALVMSFELGKAVEAIPFLSPLCLVLSLAYGAFILLTGISLFKLQKHVLKIVKAFLTTRLVFLTVCSIASFVYSLNDAGAIGSTDTQFQSVPDMVLRALIMPLLYTFAFSLLWYLYFKKSKRVGSTYENQAG